MESKLTRKLNRGGLTLPTQTWLCQYKKMDKEFNAHHPKNNVRPGRGLFRNFFLLLKSKFSDYEDPVLHLVTRMLTRFRVRRMNKEHRLEVLRKKLLKKQGKKSPNTHRGSLQLINRLKGS